VWRYHPGSEPPRVIEGRENSFPGCASARATPRIKYGPGCPSSCRGSIRRVRSKRIQVKIWRSPAGAGSPNNCNRIGKICIPYLKMNPFAQPRSGARLAGCRDPVFVVVDARKPAAACSSQVHGRAARTAGDVQDVVRRAQGEAIKRLYFASKRRCIRMNRKFDYIAGLVNRKCAR